MRALKVGDEVKFLDVGGGTRQGRVKALNMTKIRAEVEVDGRTVEVDLASILLVNGSPMQSAKR